LLTSNVLVILIILPRCEYCLHVSLLGVNTLAVILLWSSTPLTVHGSLLFTLCKERAALPILLQLYPDAGEEGTSEVSKIASPVLPYSTPAVYVLGIVSGPGFGNLTHNPSIDHDAPKLQDCSNIMPHDQTATDPPSPEFILFQSSQPLIHPSWVS
jgi:hypothetical protein